MRLSEKVALVTGAGSGIGRAIATGFAREGARVAVADINAEAAAASAATIAAAGGQAIALRVDVRRRQEVVAMVAASQAAFGRIDVLVAAAGIARGGHLLGLSEENWDEVVGVNLKGLFLCGQAVARVMAAQGGGAIINITSQLSQVAQPDCVDYLASKGGATMLTKGMALDLARFGIRVNALAPGLTNTSISPRTTPEAQARIAALLPHIVLGRMAEPEEMIGAAVFLASDEASYVTGTTLLVDGGYLAI
jgi:NAD(P)-dependent dehydrogenase (short-subunit alcohol dehydrogenase family)